MKLPGWGAAAARAGHSFFRTAFGTLPQNSPKSCCFRFFAVFTLFEQ